MNRTATEWLAIPKGNRPVALAEVLTEGPWKHEWDTCGQNAHNKCQKCGKAWASSSNAIKRNFSCPVPDPTVIDWNTAMEWRDKSQHMRFYIAMKEMLSQFVASRPSQYVCGLDYGIWVTGKATPYDYLVAAAMAQEGQG